MRATYEAIGRFLPYMLGKLRKNEYKGDEWRYADPYMLIRRIREELVEIETAVSREVSAEAVWEECADVANMAMMVADAYEAGQEANS